MGYFTYNSSQRNWGRYWYGSSQVADVAAVGCVTSLHVSETVLVGAGSWHGAPWGQSLTFFSKLQHITPLFYN